MGLAYGSPVYANKIFENLIDVERWMFRLNQNTDYTGLRMTNDSLQNIWRG